MTKRIRRISDATLIRIEADIVALYREYEQIPDKDDPAFDDQTNAIWDRVNVLEQRALSRVPSTMKALATQARIASLTLIGSKEMGQLIANIQALAGEPAPKPGIRLRHGKRYRSRQGEITARLDQMDSRGLFFGDNCTGNMYEVDGRHIGGDRCGDRAEDLVEEVPPTPRAKKQVPAYTRGQEHGAGEERVAA